MIIKTNNYYQSLYTYEGLTAWIKTADYKNTFNNIDTVVTELIITKEGSKEVLYKFTSSNYLCHYSSNIFLSITNIIEDVLYYLANNNYTTNHKSSVIYNVLNNNSIATLNIKLFNKEHKEQLKEVARQEECNNINNQIELVKLDIENTLQQINKHETIRYNKPCKLNNYTHELITANTIKVFEFASVWQEGLEGYNSILIHLKEYYNYIINDFDPIEFMKFDRVA